ncbi:MAG: single-stranded-DNA-specific exonuclease [Candidatus Peregrinibacteria bacterium Greene0416_19]|nr:MAG: single-stranded-DNA-specific exonuclease [Candidatus Peregrinibacteria bacterium Greene0416_19]
MDAPAGEEDGEDADVVREFRHRVERLASQEQAPVTATDLLTELPAVAADHERRKTDTVTLTQSLSLTGRRWIIGSDLRPALQKGSPLLLASLIAGNRGLPIGRQEGAMFDATTIRDFPVAAERIFRAIRDGELVAIFGDYDCDGITGTAQLLRFFRRRRMEPVVRLPHRQHEGYGLREATVREFMDAGIGLLITIDTGIAAQREVALARDGGMDVIIIDHHHTPLLLPPATAILHPGVAGAPEPHPAAAGLAFSVVQALEEADGHAGWDGMDIDLSLAAIGTVADLVELRGANRGLVERGIAAIRALPNCPLRTLCLHAGVTGACTSRDIAFRIAPRINAAGRMADPMIGLQALLGDMQSLLLLEQLNQERRSSVEALMRDAIGEVERTSPIFPCIASVLITPGIAGLIAGKITEKYGRPSLVASIQGDRCTASLRSIPGYHVTHALTRMQEMLQSFGGHAQAAGCTFPLSALGELRERLSADLAQSLTPHDLLPSLSVDTPLSVAHITLPVCRSIDGLEPFGQGNPEPRFLIERVTLQDMRAMGKQSNHLQARLPGIKLVGFGLGSLAEQAREPLDLVCRLGIDEWNGRKMPQLSIDDLRFASS